jgi:hypothetical protein
MSRGPGKIQRRIAEVLRAAPGGVFTVEDLAYECYGLADQPGGATVEKKHRVAVLRALYAMLPFDDWHFGNLKRLDNCCIWSTTRMPGAVRGYPCAYGT